MCQESAIYADVQENYLLNIDKNILNLLLRDRSSGKNIIWAIEDYAAYGEGYTAQDEITLEAITGARGNVIRPRALKSKETQGTRIRNMAEVFTPLWICNKQNNLADSAWLGRQAVFNNESGNGWQACKEKILFPADKGAKSWQGYLASKRLEITCGEAPYLVSRYDTLTGEIIPIEERIGLLDRKLRVINERARNLKAKKRAQRRWLQLAKLAVQSIYGYEWAGDNVLLARENLLYTLIDYYAAKFKEQMDIEALEMFAEIISWNIWQMDGLKAVVPLSCHDYKKERQAVSPNLFLTRDFSVRALKRSMSFCDVDEHELQKCQGCLKDNLDLHNGVYCKIKNWSTGKVLLFKDLLYDEGSEGKMAKDFKFDVVIGNPPYQVSDGGNKASSKPVYQYFVKSAIEIKPNCISMIMPARWFTGGKGLDEFREYMINDKHISCLHDYMNAVECFGNDVEIKGGVCYFIWEKNNNNPCSVFTHHTDGRVSKTRRYLKNGDNDIFIRYDEAISILEKVQSKKEKLFFELVSARKPFGLPTNVKVHENHKNGDIILYAQGKIGYYPRTEIIRNDDWIDKNKIYMTKAYNAGDDFPHQILNRPLIGDEGTACSETYLVIGPFKDRGESYNVISYIKTKFFRFLVSLRKLSQDATAKVYQFVPIQDFSHPWTDEMLYKKYNLTNAEIAFIESMIKPMD